MLKMIAGSHHRISSSSSSSHINNTSSSNNNPSSGVVPPSSLYTRGGDHHNVSGRGDRDRSERAEHRGHQQPESPTSSTYGSDDSRPSIDGLPNDLSTNKSGHGHHGHNLGSASYPYYSPPHHHGSSQQSPFTATNDCRIIEYRGHRIAAFLSVATSKLPAEYLLCLPQAFELFLKHLVGGLHTVYTKLKVRQGS